MWVKKIKPEGLCHNTSTAPNTKRCQHSSFFRALLHFLTFPAERKHFGMITAERWHKLCITHLPAAANAAKIGLSPFPESWGCCWRGRDFSTVQNNVCCSFLIWDFSITGLILSGSKPIPFDEAPQEGMNIIYPFPAHWNLNKAEPKMSPYTALWSGAVGTPGSDSLPNPTLHIWILKGKIFCSHWQCWCEDKNITWRCGEVQDVLALADVNQPTLDWFPATEADIIWW